MSERGWCLEIGLTAAVVLGVVFFGATYPWAASALYALLFLMCSIYPAAILTYSGLPRFFRVGMLLVFLLILLQLLAFSSNRYQTAEEFLKWLALASAFFLTQLFSPPQKRRFLHILIILGVWEIAYGMIQIASGSEMILWRTKEVYRGFLTGTFIYRNHLAGLLEICAALQLGFFAEALRRKNFKNSIFCGAIFGLILAGLFKTGSRMGAVSFFTALLLLSPFFLRKLPGMLKLVMIGLTGILAAGAAWTVRAVLFSRFSDLKEDLLIGEGRWLVWQDTLRMFLDHAWTGIGLGGFKWSYPQYQSGQLMMGWAHAHNDYLELLAELGLPAFLALAGVFLALWLLLLKKLWRSHSKHSFEFCGILLAVTSFAIHGIADFSWALFANNLVVVILLGFSVSFLRPSSTSGGDPL